MKIYYYVHTGHRIGLDRLRRSAPVIRALQEEGADVVLLASDFRAGEYAKEMFGIRKYVSVDVIRNIINIATPGDALILDSDEVGAGMIAQIAGYFRYFIRFSDDPAAKPVAGEGVVASDVRAEGSLQANVIDPRYFAAPKEKMGSLYFFADDDYEALLRQKAPLFKDLGITLLEGYYFFMGGTQDWAAFFADVLESENYDEALMRSETVLTSSVQTALEAAAAGAKVGFVAFSEPVSELPRQHGIAVLTEPTADDLRTFLANPAQEAATIDTSGLQKVINYVKKSFNL